MQCAISRGMIARSLDELAVYQKALVACDEISALVERPKLSSDCELRRQLTSAAGSIPANIAEGFGQQTDRQFVRYLCFARGSSKELRAHLAVALGRNYLTPFEAQALSDNFEEIAKMLTGLIKYLRKSDRKHRG
jgi:four helix bundle protein